MGAAVALAVALSGGRAGAEPPRVRMVPDVKTRDGSWKTLFDRVLPSSDSFILEVPIAADLQVVGSLDVWPAGRERGHECDAGPQPPGTAPQTYQLGMTRVERQGRVTLEAEVPALQVAQRYCFLLHRTVTLQPAQLTEAVSAVAAECLGCLQQDRKSVV